MSNRYAQITFSAGAVEMQQRAGSFRDYGAQLAQRPDGPQPLDMRESGFIRAADSFFLGTATPDGWPYIQHRGGPKGFVQVLDQHTIAFADLSGNQQYVTVGNLTANSRVALFFIDYPLRERLKVFGTARVVERAEDADLVDRVSAAYSGAIQKIAERALVISVEAYNWNCVKFIKPRFGKERLDEALRLERKVAAEQAANYETSLAELRRENDALRAELAAARSVSH